MMKKKISITAFSVLVTFLFITVASAWVTGNFDFTTMGQREEVTESLQAGTPVLRASYGNTNTDASLGLSLSKKGLFGNYSFIDRCNKDTMGRSEVSCTYNKQKDGTYKGTIVLNRTNDGRRIFGKFWLKIN